MNYLKKLPKTILYILLSLFIFTNFNLFMSRFAITTTTPEYEQRIVHREMGLLCDLGGRNIPDTGFPLTTADTFNCNQEGKRPTTPQFLINTVLYIALIQIPVTYFYTKRGT